MVDALLMKQVADTVPMTTWSRTLYNVRPSTLSLACRALSNAGSPVTRIGTPSESSQNASSKNAPAGCKTQIIPILSDRRSFRLWRLNAQQA